MIVAAIAILTGLHRFQWTLFFEYLLDAVHFRIVPKGDFVRERLVDEKVFLE